MRFSLLWRRGTSTGADEVSDEAIFELLSELDDDEDDAEHGDVWLTENASGWAIGVFAGDRGLVVLENTEPGGNSFHRTGMSRQDAFNLLRRAADGHLGAIRTEAWDPGYGSELDDH